MPEILKEKIIAEYKRLKAKIGRKPSSREFIELTNFKKRQLEKVFGGGPYNKLVKMAGDEPSLPVDKVANPWTNERALESWGNAVKRLNHKPSQAEWSHLEFKPSIGWYEKKYGSWRNDVPKAFLAFANGKQEWIDVIELLTNGNGIETEQSSLESAEVDDFQSFIPPVVQDLKTLSVAEGRNLEFEQKTNLAFQLLGFQVKRLGQGTGRNNDGIAVDRENHYAVFIDSKARRDGYSVGTDDRAFIEYTRTWEDDLKRQGIKHIYFAVVSSRFKGGIERAAENLKKETSTSALVLISAEVLLKLVATKIRFPAEFNLRDLKDLLVQDGVLEQKKVERFIESCRTL